MISFRNAFWTEIALVFLSSSVVAAAAPVQQAPQQKAASEYLTIENIAYRNVANSAASAAGNSAASYVNEMCRLDVYHPTTCKGAPTVVWFHGGGLTGGSKSVPRQLQGQGVVVVAVNYKSKGVGQHPRRCGRGSLDAQ